MTDITESDWKIFRPLRQAALDRFAQRILEDARRVLDKTGKPMDRYYELYKLIKERDKEIARMFDDFSRSHAVMQLINFRYDRLVTDDEFARFSDELKVKVDGFLATREERKDAGPDEPEA